MYSVLQGRVQTDRVAPPRHQSGGICQSVQPARNDGDDDNNAVSRLRQARGLTLGMFQQGMLSEGLRYGVAAARCGLEGTDGDGGEQEGVVVEAKKLMADYKEGLPSDSESPPSTTRTLYSTSIVSSKQQAASSRAVSW